MITKDQAEAIIMATSYRDWDFQPVSYAELVMPMILGMISVEVERKVVVKLTYRAPNSTEGLHDVTNAVQVALPLTETEAQFARALYELVSIIEEHERREFFRVDHSVIKDRPREVAGGRDSRGWVQTAGSSAIFHPHGINRNKLFHDLDSFAEKLDIKDMVGAPMSSDAA